MINYDSSIGGICEIGKPIIGTLVVESSDRNIYSGQTNFNILSSFSFLLNFFSPTFFYQQGLQMIKTSELVEFIQFYFHAAVNLFSSLLFSLSCKLVFSFASSARAVNLFSPLLVQLELYCFLLC